MTYTSLFLQDGLINDGVSKLLEVIAANSTSFQYSTLVALSANVVGAKAMWNGKIDDCIKNKEYLKLVAQTCLHTTWHLSLYGATAISMQENIFTNPDITAVALLGFTAISSAVNIFSIYSAIKNYFAGPVPEITLGKLPLESSFLPKNLVETSHNIPEDACAVQSTSSNSKKDPLNISLEDVSKGTQSIENQQTRSWVEFTQGNQFPVAPENQASIGK